MKATITCNVFTLSREGQLFPGARVTHSPTDSHPWRLSLTDCRSKLGHRDPGLPIFADPSVISETPDDVCLIEKARLRLIGVELDDFPKAERFGQTYGRHVVHQLAKLQPLAGAAPAETLIWVPFPVNVEGGLPGGCEARGATPFELGRQLGDYRCLLLALGGKLDSVILTVQEDGKRLLLRAVPGSQISDQIQCPCVTVCDPESYRQSRLELEAAFNAGQVTTHFFSNVI